MIGITTLAVIGLGYPSFSPAAEQTIEQMIVEAKTPADHEAIAAFYADEAKDARHAAAYHERMRDSYSKHYPTKKATMVRHCNRLAEQYAEAANEYEDLAKLHTEMAETPTVASGEPVAQAIDEANTPADHAALATFYETEAQAARQKATKHSAMRDLYTKRYPTKKSSLIRICEQIVEKYTGMAEEYEVLAQLHKDLATAKQ